MPRMSAPSGEGGGHDLAGRLPARVPEHRKFHLHGAVALCNSDDDCLALMEYIMSAPLRAGRVAARRCRRHLSERELAVMASVSRYRYLSARQIEELHFFDHASPLTGARTCRRVLERLTDVGVLRRLERRIGGVRAGSASFVYALAPLGHRILDNGNGGRVRRREPSEEFLDHTLAIAELAVNLHRLARGDESVAIIRIEPEPGCWRRFTADLEGTQTLKPDLTVSLRAGDYEYLWFIEVDLATHSGAAVVRKCHLYHRYWSTGIEQDRSGIFPRVLFVTPGLRRAGLLKRSIASARHLNHELFTVTTIEDAGGCLTGAAT